MRKIESLKLSRLCKSELDERMQNALRGGQECGCSCECSCPGCSCTNSIITRSMMDNVTLMVNYNGDGGHEMSSLYAKGHY